MSGHKPWSEIRHKARPEEIAEARRMIEEVTPWYLRLGRGLREFFTPRDWVPTFPIPRKPYAKAQGYQSLYEALRGFKKDGDGQNR